MSRSQIRGTQIKDDSITGDDVDESTLILNTLRDADGDTKVQVEEAADEDKIRFDIAGNEIARIESAGLFVSGAIDVTPGDGEGLTFYKTEDEINFIKFANANDGVSYNAYFAYQVAEHLYISPGRGADFYVLARTNAGGDPLTFSFRIMDDGTAKFEKRQSDSAVSAADLPEDIAFYVSGSTEGFNNALFGGNVVTSGSLTVGGDLEVSQYIRHIGDSNTHINFADDKIILEAGNISMITMEEKSQAPHDVRINNGGNNIDFVVEDNSGDVLLMTDADTSRVGINTDSPDSALEVVNNNPTVSTLQITTTEDAGSASPILELKRNSASPSAGDYIGQLKFQGENDADQQVTYAKMTAKITDAQDTTEDGLLEFALRKNGSNSIAVQLSGDEIKTKNGCGLEVDGNTEIKGGIKKSSIRDVNSSTTATDTDYILRCIHNSPITITLPSKGGNAGQELIIKDALGNAGTHTITIDGAGSDTIDGLTTRTLSGNFKCLTLVCDGINGWMIVGSYEG